MVDETVTPDNTVENEQTQVCESASNTQAEGASPEPDDDYASAEIEVYALGKKRIVVSESDYFWGNKKYRMPMLPTVTYRKADKHSCSVASFKWSGLSLYTTESLSLDFSISFTPSYGLALVCTMLYIRCVITIPLLSNRVGKYLNRLTTRGSDKYDYDL